MTDQTGIERGVDEGDGAVTMMLLTVDGALLGTFGLIFTPMYVGAVPMPLGAVLSILILPWLVRRAGSIDTRASMAGAPLWAWAILVVVLGFIGPGGDVLLPQTWQSLLLIIGSLGAGLWALLGVLRAEAGRHPRG